jgi:hypothetical protein
VLGSWISDNINSGGWGSGRVGSHRNFVYLNC